MTGREFIQAPGIEGIHGPVLRPGVLRGGVHKDSNFGGIDGAPPRNSGLAGEIPLSDETREGILTELRKDPETAERIDAADARARLRRITQMPGILGIHNVPRPGIVDQVVDTDEKEK